jgi:hypothetical protein
MLPKLVDGCNKAFAGIVQTQHSRSRKAELVRGPEVPVWDISRMSRL